MNTLKMTVAVTVRVTVENVELIYTDITCFFEAE